MACKYPIMVENQKSWIINSKGETGMRYHKVPCGQCSRCKQGKARQWIFRLKQEAKASCSAYFCTLTYDDEHLVYSESGEPTLHKPDLQKFIKRLRKRHKKTRDSNKLTYYIAGEYGPHFTRRPHYHALIFNAYQKDIETEWYHGFTHVGFVNNDSIAYNTKYMLKENHQYQHQFKDDPSFIKEFAIMSKGIGKNYVEDPRIKAFHKQNLDRPYVTDEKGYKYQMPKYYKQKLFTEDELRHIRKRAQARHEETMKTQTEEDLQREVPQYVYEDYLFNNRLKQSKLK